LEAPYVRGKLLGEDNGFGRNRKFATHFVFDLELVLYVEKEPHLIS
jgi:hypothetical protein